MVNEEDGAEEGKGEDEGVEGGGWGRGVRKAKQIINEDPYP